jgi:hypothetical protein
MTWNYRILVTNHPLGRDYYAVHEVFYDYDNSDIPRAQQVPNSWTSKPIDFGGDTVDEVRKALAQALDDCTRQTPLRIVGSKLEEYAQG